jgi:hypothetical protein
MKKIAKAHIEWLKIKSNQCFDYIGIFHGQRFSPIMKFISDDGKDGIFSSIVANEKFIGTNQTISFVSYAIRSAPFDLMVKDAEFELFDGANIIGRGKVLNVYNGQFVYKNNRWMMEYDN